jgi:antitoxin component YwqK of YwqJK toxin-antitoxin module
MTRVPQSSLQFEEGVMMLDGTPFTGVGFIERNGEVIEETEYQRGMKWGVSKTLFPGGKPYKHTRLFAGVRHGRHRQWHFNGELAEEADYELGFLVRRKKWDEDGDPIDDFQLEASDPEHGHLEQVRESYKELLDREKPPLDLE